MAVKMAVTMDNVCCNVREHDLDRVSVHFYARVSYGVIVRDRVHDLVRCGVRVRGRVRVRDSARFHFCFHVSISGRDLVRCGVRVRSRVRSCL